MKSCSRQLAGVVLWTAGQSDKGAKKSDFVWKVKTRQSKDFRTVPMAYTNWFRGEPNDQGGKERCVNLWPQMKFHWNDQECSYKGCFVCDMTN